MTHQIQRAEVAEATRLLDAVREEWLKHPDVTAVDIGLHYVNGYQHDGIAIRVHVSRSLNGRTYVDFPKQLGEFPVDVIEVSYALQTAGADVE